MFDLGLGSFEALSLEELFVLLLAMAAWIALIAFVGLDTIVVAVVVSYTIPIAAEVVRRAYRRAKLRLWGD